MVSTPAAYFQLFRRQQYIVFFSKSQVILSTCLAQEATPAEPSAAEGAVQLPNNTGKSLGENLIDGIGNAGKSVWNGAGWLLERAKDGTKVAINASVSAAKWVNGILVSGGKKVLNGTIDGGKEVMNVTEEPLKKASEFTGL